MFWETNIAPLAFIDRTHRCNYEAGPEKMITDGVRLCSVKGLRVFRVAVADIVSPERVTEHELCRSAYFVDEKGLVERSPRSPPVILETDRRRLPYLCNPFIAARNIFVLHRDPRLAETRLVVDLVG